jgi:glyoxylase-like metal-dependent hydrolase (beta-lactamase superfamily II)
MKIKRFIFSPIEENTYVLIDDSGDCAIIDCGCYEKSEFEELENFITENKLNPVLLLNTHCHLDHIFGNRFMQNKYGLRTLCHEKEEYNRTNAAEHALLFGLSMEDSPSPERLLNDNDFVEFGNTKLKALHVPGHSPGSLAFYCEKDNVVFTGDALFPGSIGRTDLPGGDFETLTSSIKTKLFTLPEETVVYAGHGGETTIGKEIRTNPWFNMT